MRTTVLERMKVQGQNKELRLLEVLSEIGPDAVPYQPELVEKYKEEMVKKDIPFLLRHGWKPSDVLVEIVAWCVLVLLFATGVLTIGELVSHHWLAAFLWGVIGFSAAVFLWVCCASPLINACEYRPEGWKRQLISEYPKPIQEFALETAAAVKERLPEAEFFIESFVKGKRDPFLVMRYNNRDYHLEVWNEPKFRTQRLA